MSEWKSFKDECPDEHRYIWVSNYSEAWIANSSCMVSSLDHVWKYAKCEELPIKPEIEEHCCAFYASYVNGICYETPTGLWIRIITTGPVRTSTEFKVNFCHVCGYSIPKEKDYINQRCC